MRAAVSALRQLNATRIIVAAPIIAGSAYSEMQRAADEVATVMVPENFYAVGLWYKDFAQRLTTKFKIFSPGLLAVSW
jgi:putative phosphoribosyl transferase